MGKLFKHKRRPNKETKAFSKNTTKPIKKLKGGREVRQSILSGKKQIYNKKGKPIGKEFHD